MKIFLSRRFALPAILFLLLTSVFTARGASADVDPGFNPQLTFDLNGASGKVLFLPDGKMIFYGSSSGRSFVKRLNPDGSADPTFNCPACAFFSPATVGRQPDGKLIVGGSRTIRINADGSLDPSFVENHFNVVPPCLAVETMIQTDGKVLNRCLPTGTTDYEFIRRLMPDGSLDPNFTTINFLGGANRQFVSRTILLPDGKILVGGGSLSSPSNAFLTRFNTNGSIDNTFQVNVTSRVLWLELEPSGNYLISGSNSYNGIGRAHVARIFPDGTVDPGLSITLLPDDYTREAKSLPNGQFYLRVEHAQLRIGSTFRYGRFNANGTLDLSFNGDLSNNSSLWDVDPAGRMMAPGTKPGFPFRYRRYNLDGSVDTSFDPAPFGNGNVNDAVLQSDGKIMVVGDFHKANGLVRGRIARLNPDGTTDPTFDSGTGFDVAPTKVRVQADGKILAMGNFANYNGTMAIGTPGAKILRLNPDGTIDFSFLNPGFTSTNFTPFLVTLEPLANGKLLIGGNFSSVYTNNYSVPQNSFARLNADGSPDQTFTPAFPAGSSVSAILVEPDGKIMVGGNFFTVNGSPYSRLVRLNADGTTDTGFVNPQLENVDQIVRTTSGKYIVGIRQSSFALLARVNNDGTRDWSLINASLGSNTTVDALALQADGRILASAANGKYVRRFNQNGDLDPSFPQFGANGRVYKILRQTDGKIIFAGLFTGFEEVGRTGIARVTVDSVPVIKSPTDYDFDGDQRADFTVFRPGNNTWYKLLSGDWSVAIQGFGQPGDVPTPADYDGDGKTDIGVFRASEGKWHYIRSSDNTVAEFVWGVPGDIPLPFDINGTGRARPAIFRPTTGEWYLFGGLIIYFGVPGDKPLVGDFDGDAKSDLAIFRPSTGDWWYAASSANREFRTIHWGQNGDIPVPADYDGDGKTDFVVFRPSDGGWYILYSSGSYTIATFGQAGDKPVAADYDGDGKADLAVWRPSTGTWYLLQTTAGFGALTWGMTGDIPAEGAYVP